MQYWIIVNVHWIPTFEWPSSCHKRPGLLTYLFYCSKNDSKLKDWINFGIDYRKKLLSRSRPWRRPWLTGLGLDTCGLVNIRGWWMRCLDNERKMCVIMAGFQQREWRSPYTLSWVELLPDQYRVMTSFWWTREKNRLIASAQSTQQNICK